MSLTNSSVGLQRDDNTMALYKSIREFDPDLGDGVYGTGIADSTGNYPLKGDSTPRITNGPLEDAGWQLNPPQFARSFCSNLCGFVRGLTTIDQDYNDAIRATFTQQFMFKFEWSHNATRGIYGANNEVGSGSANDWLARLLVLSTGHFHAFWESNDTNFDRTTTSISQGDPPVQIGKWQVVTVVWTVGTGYAISFYVHTLDSPGVVTGGLIESFGDYGVLPLSTSGVGNSQITYGRTDQSGGDNPFIGPIAFGRIYKGTMNAATVLAQAEELLTTGTLASVANTNDLHRHEFNEPPDWIDEGPYGLHCDATAMIVDRDSRKHHIDLLGSGGRSRRNTESYARFGNLALAKTMGADHGTSQLSDFFNDTIFTVPEYTFQFWGILRNGGSTVIADWFGNSESESQNFLFHFTLVPASGDLEFVGERGGGTNIGRTNIVTMGAFGTDLTEQSILVTIRAGEKVGSPGVMQVRVSINDQLDAISFDLSTGIPSGGTGGPGPRWGWPNEGQLQEFKWSLGMISDQQILDDFARLLDREGAPDPVIVSIEVETEISTDVSNQGPSMAESNLPIDIELGTNDEVTLVDGDLVLTRGVAATAQQCSLALRSFKGEWVYDLDDGTPWFQDVLGQKYSEAQIRGVIRNALLGVDTVASVEKLELSFNRGTRNVTINWAVLSSAGEVVEGNASI